MPAFQTVQADNNIDHVRIVRFDPFAVHAMLETAPGYDLCEPLVNIVQFPGELRYLLPWQGTGGYGQQDCRNLRERTN